jgi:hypothetical protein
MQHFFLGTIVTVAQNDCGTWVGGIGTLGTVVNARDRKLAAGRLQRDAFTRDGQQGNGAVKGGRLVGPERLQPRVGCVAV